MLFVYLRDGDRIGAPVHRVLSSTPLLLDTPLKRIELPEGADILEYRKEREAVGVEFRYRLVSFKDWMSAQDQHTVRKWTGEDPSNYSKAPEGTFWSEYATNEEKWVINLLSLETGEPVEGHEDLVAEQRETLLKKTEEKMAAKASAKSEPAPAPETAPEASVDTETAPSTPEGSEAAPSEAGAASDEAAS